MVRRLAVCGTFILCLGAAQPAPAQDTEAQGAETKVWIGHYGEYEEYLRTAPIDKIRDRRAGLNGREIMARMNKPTRTRTSVAVVRASSRSTSI